MGLNTQRLEGGHGHDGGEEISAAHGQGHSQESIEEHGHHAGHTEGLAQAETISQRERARQQGETRFDKEPLLPKISDYDSGEHISLGHVLSVVGDALLKARAKVQDELEKEAEAIDEDERNGRNGNSAKRNQRIAALTFTLQTLQQVDNIVGEAVQSVSRTQSEGLKSVAQNLRV